MSYGADHREPSRHGRKLRRPHSEGQSRTRGLPFPFSCRLLVFVRRLHPFLLSFFILSPLQSCTSRGVGRDAAAGDQDDGGRPCEGMVSNLCNVPRESNSDHPCPMITRSVSRRSISSSTSQPAMCARRCRRNSTGPRRRFSRTVSPARCCNVRSR
jgi:hypothetical protein